MRILAAGLPREATAHVKHRLATVQVVACPTWRTLAVLRDSGPFALLVLAADAAGQAALDMLAQVRSKYDAAVLPIVCLLPGDVPAVAAHEQVDGLRVQQTLASPADAEEIVLQVAHTLRLSIPLAQSAPHASSAPPETLERRLDSLEQIVAAPMTDDMMHLGVVEAHKLAEGLADREQGSAARLAWRLSEALAARVPFSPPAAVWVAEIRALSQQPADGAAAIDAPRLLLVDRESPATELLVSAALSRGMAPLVAHDLNVASDWLQSQYPEVVVMDPALTDSWDDIVAFFNVALASTFPPVLAVWTARSEQEARVASAQLGAATFLPKPATEDEVMGMVEDLLYGRSRSRLDTLVVSQDDATLAAVSDALTAADIPCTLLGEPQDFWKSLAATSPEVLVIDLDMTDVGGLDLCRMVRMDENWRGLPILALTDSPDLVTAAYEAGADDVAARPIAAAELAMRVTKRVERRSGLDANGEGGVAGRRRFVQYLLQLQRRKLTFSLGVIGLDSFQEINMGLDFESGDTVLRRVGRLLGKLLPEPRRLTRWCGDQFLVCLEGMGRDAARQVLDEAVEALQYHSLGDLAGRPLTLTFSAGVAEYPIDGLLIDDLYRMGMRGLNVAKRGGRSRVVSSSWFEDPNYQEEPADVVIVHQDEDLVDLARRVLEARGFSVQGVTDHNQAWSVLTPAIAARPGLVAVIQVDPSLAESVALLETFGQNNTAEPICIIALVDQTHAENIDEAFNHGAWLVLGADAPFPLLIQRVREALAR